MKLQPLLLCLPPNLFRYCKLSFQLLSLFSGRSLRFLDDLVDPLSQKSAGFGARLGGQEQA